MSQPADRNFDDLAHRFKRNVYDRLKGDIRLAVLNRDFSEYIATLQLSEGRQPLKILDAGGGQGQFSLQLASLGHDVLLCDISAKMLEFAQQQVHEQGLENRVRFYHGSIQELAYESSEQFDLVLCHAVLEWVSQPQILLESLCSLLASSGYLSLTFYNVNGIVLKNMLRTNFQKVTDEDFRGYSGSLTPTYPRKPEDVLDWLSEYPLNILCRSGIRCFHDYILDPIERNREPEQQLALELKYSRIEPWLSLGRYIHVLMQKT